MRFKTTGLFLGLTLAALVAIAPARAQGPGGRGMMGGGGPMAGLMVLSTPEGQAELKITEEQKAKLQDVVTEIQGGMRERFQAMQDVPQEERRAKMEEAMREIGAEAKTKLAAVLDEKQIKRYEQISIQAAGYSAFNMPEVQEKLKITDDQKEKLAAVQQEAMESMRAAFQDNQGDREGMMKAMTELRTKSMEKAVAILTAEQKAAWKELIGAPFTMPAFGGRGAGGPGSGGRRQID